MNSNKYFNIGRTNEIEIIGFYPQTDRTSNLGFHIDAYNSEKQMNKDEFPDFEPNIGLDLNPKANATDLIDRTACLSFGLVVSEKLKAILEKYNLPPHRFYPIKVFNTKVNYYWLHYITRIEHYLDFKATEVEVFNLREMEVVQILKFDDWTEMKTASRDMVSSIGSFLRYKKIQLTKDFPNYDLFEITGAQYFNLISAELKSRLISEKITGIEFLEYDKVELYT